MKLRKDPLTRVAFVNTSLPVGVIVYPSDERPGWWIVRPMIYSLDRRTRTPESFSIEYRFKCNREPGRARLARWVRRATRGLLAHELDEALHVDGVRMFDPHPRRRKKK